MANANNAAVGKPKIGGAIYRAPLGTALPTDATTALDSAFVQLGYIADSGLVNSRALETGSIKAWGGDTVINYSNGGTDTFNFNLLEVLNEDVCKAVYGDDNVTGTLADGLSIKVNNEQQPNACWVAEMVMGSVLKRIVVPDAGVSTVGDITYNDTTAVGYNTTISALPDTDGNTHYEYMKTK